MTERLMARVKSITPEEKAEHERRLALQENAHRQWEFQRLLSDAQVPKRHSEKNIEKVGEWAEKLQTLSNLIAGKNGPLIALVGVRGNGKTQLAVELIRETCRAQKAALFATATEFFMEIKSSFKRDSDLDESEILHNYERPFLLVIDEIGKRGGTDWENNLLFELLNRRYNAMKPTVLIDNRSLSDFVETIGPSLASRMTEGGGIIECKWESFRGLDTKCPTVTA